MTSRSYGSRNEDMKSVCNDSDIFVM